MIRLGGGSSGAAAMSDSQKSSRVLNEHIEAMRAVLGNGVCEMDLVHSLHLARNDVQMAINILFDTPGFRNKPPSPAKSPAAVNRRNSLEAGSSSSARSPSTTGSGHKRSSGDALVEAGGLASTPQGSSADDVQVEVCTETINLSTPVKVEGSSEGDSSVQMVDSALSGLRLENAAEPSSSLHETSMTDFDDQIASASQIASQEPKTPEKSSVPDEVKGPVASSSPVPDTVTIDDETVPVETRSNVAEPVIKGTTWPDAPDETKWLLLEEAEVVCYSTTSRGGKIRAGDFVSFNFPKPGVGEKKPTDGRKHWKGSKPSSDIIRVRTAAGGEIARLPADWAKCVIPLVHSKKITISGRCRSAPEILTLMSSILLDLRIYINQSFFKKYKGTISLEESTFRPFPSLLLLLGKSPVRKADFTPDDLHVYTRKGLQAEEAPAEKRLKSGSSDAEDREMEDSEVDHVVGTSDSRELQEMDEPEGLECKLRPYQKQALFWMSKLEVGVTREDAAKTLHPCWSEYKLADSSSAPFYVNAFSGEATMDFPSAMQTTRGGILADAMGLGKTVMTISLLLSQRGKGSLGLSISADKSNTRQSQMKAGGTLIVCPMTLLSQWRSELEAHVSSGTFSVYAYYGSDRAKDAKSLAKYDVVLTTYGVVQSEGSSNGTDGPIHSVHWFRIVLDEAHTIKGSKTASAQAVFKLTGDRRLCLTGTPVQNKLEDLYSLFCFLRVEPWCNWGWWHKLIQKPYEEGDERGLKLLQVILKPLMLRRTKDSTDKDGRPILSLPQADSAVIVCDLSEAERDFYDALYHKSKVKFDEFVEQGKVLHNYASILELLLRLRQTCDHPFLVLSRGDTEDYSDLKKLARRFMKDGTSDAQGPSTAFVSEVVDDIRKGENVECPICLEVPEDAVLTPCAHRMCRECLFSSWRTAGGGLCPICRGPCKRQDLITVPTSNRFRIDVEEHWTESCKVKALLEELETSRGAGSKSVVFSQWTAFLDLLEIPLKRKKFHFVRLDGTLSQRKREQVLDEFNSNSSVSLMLISLKAGGVGLNLTVASNAFLLDPWWNPAVEEQAIMRIHRIGQKNRVSIKRFIVKGTVEERMQQVQARKQRMIAGALTDEEVRSARIEELKMLFR